MWLQVLTGREAGKTVEVAAEELVVGSDRRCGLVLRGEGVAPRHAVLRRVQHGGHSIEDLGSATGTFVAGRRIRGEVELQGREQLCFGETFAALSPTRPHGSWRRSRWPIAAVAALGLATVAGTAVLLVPRTRESEAPIVRPAAEAAAGAPEPVPPLVLDAAKPATPSSEAGTPAKSGVAFRDDFSDPGSGWEVFEEDAALSRYEDGELVIAVRDPAYYATVDSGRSVAQPVVDVVVRNPRRAPAAGFGVLCNYRGPRSFDLLAFSTDGSAAILRRRGGPLTVVSEGGWVRSPRIPVAADRYALRAKCTRDTLSLFVNGARVARAGTAPTRGRIGLFAAGEAEFRVDEVVVRDG
jgi:hypothetical protein